MLFSAAELDELPVDLVAWRLLGYIINHHPRAVRRDSEIMHLADEAQSGQATKRHDLRDRNRFALAEAWSYLESAGLIVQWPSSDSGYSTQGFREPYRASRLGLELDALGEQAPRHLAARQRLGLELHPALRSQLRTLVAVGAFEQATSVALRIVEARVRRLARDPRNDKGSRLTGVPLMQMAFSERDGPLADPDAEPGERRGTMNLFAGTFGAIRNALAHTEVEWTDPTEAAEMVLLADLLMRQLDRVEQRATGPAE